MNFVQIGIIIFAVIETLNVIILYFQPGTQIGNGVGVFNAWHKAQEDQEMKDFVSYMTSWVAGAKLIFIMVGIGVVVFGNIETQLATALAMVISISSFFFKLYPMILKLDRRGEITPKGYSKALLGMIVAFIVGFAAVFIGGVLFLL